MNGSSRYENMSRISLMSLARIVFWWIAAGILLVVPWLFGGMSFLGYKWVVNSGWICLGCLAVWLWNCGKLHPRPGFGFWIAVICWSLLGLQIWLSTRNPSHLMDAPWSASYYVFRPVAHNTMLPSSAFWGASLGAGELYLGLGLISLTAYSLGMERTAFRRLMMLFVANAAVLAVVGIPFKYSGKKLILGVWEFSEWYFYSTFYYHNHWAAFVLLALGAAGSLFVARTHWVSRGLLIIAMALLAIATVVAKTRLGVLAIGVFVIFFAWFLWRNSILKSPIRIWGWVTAAAVFLGAGTFAVSNWTKDKDLSGGARQWEGLLQENPFTTRYLLLLDTIPMVLDKPLFGWGLNAYGAAFQQYQRPETIQMHGNIPTRYEHPHNDWLERLAELGLIGSSLLLIPGGFWLLGYFRSGGNSTSVKPMLIGCMVLLLFALGDMAFANRAVSAAFGLLWGLALSSSRTPNLKMSRQERSKRRH